jgi:hypothetical protein
VTPRDVAEIERVEHRARVRALLSSERRTLSQHMRAVRAALETVNPKETQS